MGVPEEAAIAMATAKLNSIHLPAGGRSIGLEREDFELDGVPGGIDLAFALQAQARSGGSPRVRRLREWQAGAAAVSTKQAIERKARSGRRARIRRTLRDGQRRISPGANLIMSGGQPIRVWSPLGAAQAGGSKSWSVEVSTEPAVQVIVEYQDGVFAPVVIYDGLTTLIVHDGAGRISGWMCAAPYAAGPANLNATNAAIAELQTTRLAPEKANELATSLRTSKHADPMLGAIAAYLYDYVGDRDNIRRMAYYYASRSQPIPFDIALLGLLPTNVVARDAVAFVPEVSEARQRAGQGHVPSFTTRSTEPINGRVGGFCPWLRQGWDYITSPDPVEEPLTMSLRAAVPYLLNSTFTALSELGAMPLIHHFKLTGDS